MKNVEERFWNKVLIIPEHSCWEWIGAKTNGGYGQIDHKIRYAHRLSWFFYTKQLPKELKVLHSCDNPGCVRPEHLFLGTQLDNMRDMYKKGRNPSRKGPRRKRTKNN